MKFTNLHSVLYLRASYPDRHISEWIDLLAQKNIQDLIIYMHKGCYHRMDCSLFACKNLRVLKLRRCLIKLEDSYNDLKVLKDLWLEDCYITKEDIKKLLKKCPSLEKFAYVNMCIQPVEVEVPSLGCLHVQGCFTDLRIKNVNAVTSLFISLSTSIENFNWAGYEGACKLSTVLAPMPNIQKLEAWSHSMEVTNTKHFSFLRKYICCELIT